VGLTIIGVINSAIGAYYYLRIIVVMYMRDAREEVPVLSIQLALGAALAIALAATVYMGVLPDRMLTFLRASTQQLLQEPARSPQRPGIATY